MAKAIFLSALALTVAYGFVPREEPSRVYAVGAKGAVLMAPPELVAGAYVKSLTWTADGSALVVQRLVVEGAKPADLLAARQREGLAGVEALSRRREVVAWNVRARRSRVLLPYDATGTTLGVLTPVPGGDRLIAELTERGVDPTSGAPFVRESYALMSVGTGVVTRLPIPDPTRARNLEFSPTGRIAIVQHAADYRNRAVAFVGTDGKVGRLFPLPERSSFGFAEAGRPVVSILVPADERGRRRFERHAFDPVTGALGPVAPRAPVKPTPGVQTPTATAGGNAPPAVADDEDGPPKEMTVNEIALSPGSRGVVLALAPGKPENVGIVTGDGTEPVLSPRNDAVAYLSGGSAFVRTLTRLSLDEYRVAAALAERGRLLDRGRSIGVALAMYASDADDAMPPSEANVSETVQPYAKNRNVFDGFVYTFGGPLPASDRGSVPLGYIPGAGGRVVVYADGSVRWVPDGA